MKSRTRDRKSKTRRKVRHLPVSQRLAKPIIRKLLRQNRPRLHRLQQGCKTTGRTILRCKTSSISFHIVCLGLDRKNTPCIDNAASLYRMPLGRREACSVQSRGPRWVQDRSAFAGFPRFWIRLEFLAPYKVNFEPTIPIAYVAVYGRFRRQHGWLINFIGTSARSDHPTSIPVHKISTRLSTDVRAGPRISYYHTPLTNAVNPYCSA